MVDPRLMDGGEAGVVKAPQVDVGDLGPERVAGLKRHDADAGRPVPGTAALTNRELPFAAREGVCPGFQLFLGFAVQTGRLFLFCQQNQEPWK